MKLKKLNNAAGFTLIEILVALTLFTFAVLGLAVGTVTITRTNHNSHLNAAAINIAQAKLEELRAMKNTFFTTLSCADYSTLGCSDTQAASGKTFTRSWKITANSPAAGMNKINIKIDWTDYTTGNDICLIGGAVTRPMKFHHRPMPNCLYFALKTQRGFTLTELLVSMGLSLLRAGRGRQLFAPKPHCQRPGKQNGSERYAIAVLDMVVREVRNAGYFPSTACDATGGITSASATSVTIQYDKDSNGACGGDEEIVVFAFDSANKNVTRNGVALSDGNVTAIEFTYYPQQTSSSAPAPYCISGAPSGCSGALSGNERTVQKIAIALTVAPKKCR